MLAVSTTPAGAGFDHKTTWTVRGDGSLDAYNQFQPFGQLPPLPRIGVVLRIADPYNTLRWYGCGPHENYVDRKQAADVGVWSSTVEEQYVPYPLPQETGTKTDVRWLSLTDSSGAGLLVTAKEPMAFSALRYTAADLDRADHTFELKPREEVILSLDAKHSGLGNGSCGPGVLPCYEVPPVPVELHLGFRRCPAGCRLGDFAGGTSELYRLILSILSEESVGTTMQMKNKRICSGFALIVMISLLGGHVRSAEKETGTYPQVHMQHFKMLKSAMCDGRMDSGRIVLNYAIG